MDDEDDWEDLFKEFSYQDCQNIMDADLELGYKKDDIADKMDYVNRMSIKMKRQLIEDIEQNQIPKLPAQEYKDQMQAFIDDWRPKATDSAIVDAESILYPSSYQNGEIDEDILKDLNEKQKKIILSQEPEMRELSEDNYMDKLFIETIADIKRP